MRKYIFNNSLDSPERTLEHKEIIKSKKILRDLYNDWYSLFTEVINSLPEGKLVELGSGGGFFKEIEPKVLCSDIINLPSNDLTFSALQMPFEDASVSGIFMIDTMHHIPDSEVFLNEVNRVLKKGGKMIMIEPANSLWGRFIYKNFHHEPFNIAGDWTIPERGPLSGANGALPWIVFIRDYNIYQSKFPQLKLESTKFINPFLYLVSGGVSRKQMIPGFLLPLVAKLDNILPRISKELSMFMVVSISKF
ncbi:MAG TPA: class I SAM-dependent methyltransferase [Bacteroidales bacterium]|nr:class I SAM-dependent methyltransferase [Bacteroidales bacterium]